VNIKRYGVDVTEKWATATQNAAALNQAYLRGRQDERDKFDEWREEYNKEHNKEYNTDVPDRNVGGNDGWIPCSEWLPEVYEDTKSSDVVLVCGYDEESDYSWQAMGFYVHTEAIKRWFFAECKDTDKYIDWIDIVAWQPLPAPYKPKGEEV
jgi:hypothetical protein